MINRQLYKIVFSLAVVATLLGPVVTAHAVPKAGQPLPAFTVTTPSGQQVTNRNYSGKVVLVVFSTDFCSACKKAVPSFSTMAAGYGKQGFHVLGLLSGFGMDDNDLKEYMKSYGATYPMALIEQKEASERFGVISVPYSVLVDRKGMVAGVFFGASEVVMTKIDSQVKKLLAE